MQHPLDEHGHVVALLTDRMTAGATIEQAADVASAHGLGLVLVPSAEGPDTSRPTGSWLAQRIDDLRRNGSGVSASVAARDSERAARALRDARVVVLPLHSLAEALQARFRKVLVADCGKGGARLHQRVVTAVLSGGATDAAVVSAAAVEARHRRCELRLIHPSGGQEAPWATAREGRAARAAARHSHASVPPTEGLSVSTFCAAGGFAQVVPRYSRNVELMVIASTGDAQTDLERIRLVAPCASSVLLLQAAPPVVPRPRPEPAEGRTVRALVGPR